MYETQNLARTFSNYFIVRSRFPTFSTNRQEPRPQKQISPRPRVQHKKMKIRAVYDIFAPGLTALSPYACEPGTDGHNLWPSRSPSV